MGWPGATPSQEGELESYPCSPANDGHRRQSVQQLDAIKQPAKTGAKRYPLSTAARGKAYIFARRLRRPRQPRRSKSLQHALHGGASHTQRTRNHALAEPLLETQSRNSPIWRMGILNRPENRTSQT